MMKNLLSNLSKSHESVFDESKLAIFTNNIIDNDYLAFLQTCNGGYFFSGAFHIFGTVPTIDYCDINGVNRIVAKAYNGIYPDNFFYVFGEDIFGNLFVYTTKGIELFFIESGEIEFIANDFISAVNKVCQESSYYTGFEFVSDSDMKDKLCAGYRYCPKIPFVLGGDYLEDNLVLKNWLENIEFSASIARQIFNAPNGTKFKIETG